ncbi:hypothetical protein KY290_031755 [Solanum tuberosum]|uniref:Uncharacterized protein n=1 Tax=Solanum tuberosum TaxID=4113 RepID=A0ABQ7UBU3_SOLTU|nr:hypothetical protein KY285_031015 [Solanum tuberosum]KAH0743762.1 hypothetical protein KY290_031755 [Solanum tuberosum]
MMQVSSEGPSKASRALVPTCRRGGSYGRYHPQFGWGGYTTDRYGIYPIRDHGQANTVEAISRQKTIMPR